ncbi:MAG: ABC transporter permease subunit [Phycisphaerales bacterium]
MTRVFLPIASVAGREFGALFRVPAGWIVLALFLFLTSAVFTITSLVPGAPATLRGMFGVSTLLVILIAPAISMRLISEELRSGTHELLLSSPVAAWQIVTGKYLAACGFVVVMIAPTLIHFGVLRSMSEPAPDLGPVLAGMVSLALLGSLCVSLGLVASTLTESQTLAFLGTVLALVAWVLATQVAPAYAPSWLGDALASASLTRRIDDFARGVIDLSHVLFFLSVSAWFVLAAAVALELRRWR